MSNRELTISLKPSLTHATFVAPTFQCTRRGQVLTVRNLALRETITRKVDTLKRAKGIQYTFRKGGERARLAWDLYTAPTREAAQLVLDQIAALDAE